VYLPADGVRGGILLAVDESIFRISSVELGVHSVTAKVTDVPGTEGWFLTAVYGP
jgi:hypothetical protein